MLSWKIDSNLGSWSKTSTLYEQKNIKASKLVLDCWIRRRTPRDRIFKQAQVSIPRFHSASLAARYDNVPNPHRLFENSTTGPLYSLYRCKYPWPDHPCWFQIKFVWKYTTWVYCPTHASPPPVLYTGGCYSGQLTLILRKNIYLSMLSTISPLAW